MEQQAHRIEGDSDMTQPTGVPTPCDPIHDRPAKATADELRYDLESLHGLALHGERTALLPEARHAFHLMAGWTARILWPVTP